MLLWAALVGQLAAADKAPVLTAEDLASDWSLLHLPDDPVQANALLYRYNAAKALQLQQAEFPGKLLDLATIRSLRGDQSIARYQGVQWWSMPSDGQTIDPQHDGFDLRRSPHVAKRLVLAIPPQVAAQHAVIQTWLDSEWRAAGGRGSLEPSATVDKERSFAAAVTQLGVDSGVAQLRLGNYLMIAVGLVLLYLGIAKGFEPLLLVPIGIGCIFVNAMGADMARGPDQEFAGGVLWFFDQYGIRTGLFPLLIFLGVGALTDFGPLLANPWSALLGGAAQFGIFGAFFLAVIIGGPLLGFTMQDAGAIAIIGGADGPTSIFVAERLAPDKLGAIAVAAYSYMALVPILQPPVMRALTTQAEREIMMVQAHEVSKQAKIVFPIVVVVVCILTLPSAVPLIGMLMLGNLLRESGVTDRLAKAAQNELINLVTIALGLAVGTKLLSDKFLTIETIGILVLGCVAFVIGTATGILFGRVMCKLTGGKVNPLIGAAGVSAVPMAARVAHNEGAKANKRNMLLMHAMGPNVAGVIGSAVAAGILLSMLST